MKTYVLSKNKVERKNLPFSDVTTKKIIISRYFLLITFILLIEWGYELHQITRKRNNG